MLKQRIVKERHMTLPITIAFLALWSFCMYRYGGSLLFPPASLGVVWTVTLFTIWLCGDLYFPLTATANASGCCRTHCGSSR